MLTKKYLFISYGLALTLISSLVANEVDEENEWNEAEVAFEVDENFGSESEALQFIVDDSATNMQMTSSQQMPSQNKPLHFAFYGDFLYWGTYVTNMPWVETNYPNSSDFRANQFEFDWDVGFRLGFSYETAWRDVILSLEWTRFHPSTTNHVNTDDLFNKNFFPFWSDLAAAAVGTGTSSKAHYKIHFDQLDLTVKKEFAAAKHFKVSPFGGLRTIWTQNKLDIDDTKTVPTTLAYIPPIPAGTETHTFANMKNKLNAIGLVAGLQGVLDLGMDFEFFLSGDAALVTGLSKASNFFGKTEPVTNAPTAPFSTTIRKNELQLKPILDLAAGFVWDRSYKNWGIMFKAAYEAHLFFDLPQFIYRAETYTRVVHVDGQLAFQGLTLGAGVRF